MVNDPARKRARAPHLTPTAMAAGLVLCALGVGQGKPALAAQEAYLSGGFPTLAAESAGEVIDLEAELIWRNGLRRPDPRGATSVIRLAPGTEIGIRLDESEAALVPNALPDKGAMIYGSVGLSESWALTGRYRRENVGTATGTEASLGVRFSTRAGDQFLVEVEPSLTFADQPLFSAAADSNGFSYRSSSRGYEPAAGLQSMALGATATYSFSNRWFVSGLAQVEQFMGPARDAGLMWGETELVGGFMTGYRF